MLAARSAVLTLDSILPGDRERLLAVLTINGHGRDGNPSRGNSSDAASIEAMDFDDGAQLNVEIEESSSEPDLASFAAVDETGKSSSFGPSSALNQPHGNMLNHIHGPHPAHDVIDQGVRNQLVADAALQRQQEPTLRSRADICGVPTDTALHLLSIHWRRQHHTFPLTYRPAIMKSLIMGGSGCSDFLMYAIFAWTSKSSDRLDIRDAEDDASTAGLRFFRRCDDLLAEKRLLIFPTISTVSGLLLLGSTYNAKGDPSKGWLYTGYALRMVYDLGLHIDPRQGDFTAEDAELRRRTFWAAFICDKLQSLYLGRPMSIDLRDAHVSRVFHDTFEEFELDEAYSVSSHPEPLHSVSTFQQFCLLARIMTKIIKRFYVVGASSRSAKAALQSISHSLHIWRTSLPPALLFEPDEPFTAQSRRPPPNIMTMNATYHALHILLNRPFIADGHLRVTTAPKESWRRCTIAARSITNIVQAYNAAYSLHSAPYLLSYTLYVASTIHVRNTAMADSSKSQDRSSSLGLSLRCLEELCKANPGVRRPLNIVKKLMARHGILSTALPSPTGATSTEDVITSELSPSSNATTDFDRILSMFPSDNVVAGSDLMTFAQPTEDLFGGDHQFAGLFDFQDPLYGHMNDNMMPIYSFEGTHMLPTTDLN